MLNSDDFRKYAHQAVDWIADYLQEVEKYPVRSQVSPGQIINKLPDSPPYDGETMDRIYKDFQEKILPGMTHWQSPRFFSYFPANSSYPSVLAEIFTAALGAQCMVWETSPSAAELEEQVLNWLKQMIGLPHYFHGVIQDTASSATLVALLTAREKVSNFSINKKGFDKNQFRIYCSTETHSSIDKAVKIAGFGEENLVKVEVDEHFAMKPEMLEKMIKRDFKNGLIPVCVIATLGTTGSTAIDPLEKIAEVTRKNGIWLHVDAAFAGTALILDEYRWMINGIDGVDSFVFNPHKWMFTNFDCSAYFVKDKDSLIRTFSVNPEYLKTKTAGMVNDYRDWGIALGRRFRALKLWFVIRSYGVDGLKQRIRYHIELARDLENEIHSNPDFEMVTPRTLNLICFRFIGLNSGNLNEKNELLLQRLNASGKLYLSHTILDGKYTLRMVIGQTTVEKKHVDEAWKLIKKIASII